MSPDVQRLLPGALARVADDLDRHPDVDVCFADAIIVAPNGGYLSVSKAGEIRRRPPHGNLDSSTTFRL